MRPTEIEARALRYIDAVVNGNKIEDARVECKTAWIDDKKAARRIAGHANQARTDWILWLIGVNEDAHSIPGVNPPDYANWWSQVISHFESQPPSVKVVNVQYNGVIVVALYMETRLPPYVVKNTSGKGNIDFEVPWREGTKTKTARRQDLLRVLTPISNLPEVDFVKGKYESTKREETKLTEFNTRATFYVASMKPFIIPVHRVKYEWLSGGIFDVQHSRLINIYSDTQSEAIVEANQLILDKPTRLTFLIQTTHDWQVLPSGESFILHKFCFTPVWLDQTVTFNIKMKMRSPEEEDGNSRNSVEFTGWLSL